MPVEDDILDAFRFAKAAASSKGATSEVCWEGSPFEPLRRMANKRKSAVGVWMFHRIVQQRFGFAPTSPKSPVSSREIEGKIFKIKMSMQWETGAFAFEQIREDESYAYMVLLGLCPDDVYMWIVPKPKLIDESKAQHAESSRWVRFEPETPPEWLAPHGGPIAVGIEALVRILRPEG